MGAARRLLWVALLLGATCASAQQKQMRIQFAEPVALKAAAGHSEFDAYGRRFSLDLQRNDRLMQNLSAAARSQFNSAQLLRGKLEGVRGSWVRLTQVGSGLEGAIWDGQDLYVVTTLTRISKNLTTPIDAAPEQPVVYRLSDTLDSLPEAFCGLDERIDAASSRGVSGLKQYRNLVAQIATVTAAAPAEQLNLSLIADTAFQQQNGSASADAMLARLNIVDGIFTEQIGVLLQPTEFRLVPAGGDPFTATDASQLLDQLSTFRQNTPPVRTAGLAHLLTGKNLDANTIGIAYRDALCDSSFGVSLSDSELGPFNSALVMAHELGHNFGAEHDGAAGGTCAAAGEGYLMWPQYNGSSTFSACSLNSIAQSVAQARGICVLPAQYADLAVSAPATLDAAANSVLTLPVTVRSIGKAAALDATIKLALPTTLNFQGATLPDGACSRVGADVICQLGDIPANTERVVELRLVSPQISSTVVIVALNAANDFLPSNNSTLTYLQFTSAVDLKLAMTISPDSPYANDTIDIALDVTSTRTQTAHGGQVYVTLSDLEFDSAEPGAYSCTPAHTDPILCNLPDIPAGATTRIVLHVHGEHRGERGVYAQVQIADDGDYSNNIAQGTIKIISENDLLISASTDSLSFQTGTIQQVVYSLRAVGRVPSVGSQLRVWAPWSGQLDTVVASAGTCTFQGVNSLSLCDFGNLNPGDVRTVTVRFHTTSNGAATLQGEALYHIDDNTVWINNAVTQVYSNVPIDVIASTLSAAALEGQSGNAFAGMESVGLLPAQNVVATLEVPAAVRLTAMSVTNANNWACTLLTPQRGRCTGAFAAAGGASITYAFVSDVPGNYTAKLTISADGDANAANNISEAPLTINPYRDVGITTTETQMQLVAGQDHVVGFTVTTGARSVPGVVVYARDDGYGFDIASITAAGYSCSVDPNSGYGTCDLGTVPANTSVPVSVTYRTTVNGAQGSARVGAQAPFDDNPTNNFVDTPFSTSALTDLQLQVAQTTATAVNGSALVFPRITVTTVGPNYGGNIVVQVPLPPFAIVASISGATTFCTGTTTLSCEISPFPPGETRSIDITLTATAVGTFISNVTLQSSNDSTAGNNSGAVQLRVTAPPVSGGGSSSGGGGGSSSGGGGGGRFEWLALAFLGILVANRARRARRCE